MGWFRGLAGRALHLVQDLRAHLRRREVDAGRQLDVEVGRGIDPDHRVPDPALEHVSAAASIGADEVEVVAADLDSLGVVREAKADYGSLGAGELEYVLVGDDLGQRPVGPGLPGDRSGPDALEGAVDPHGPRRSSGGDVAVELAEQLFVGQWATDSELDRRGE